ncbi:MAG: DNA polymerase, partial [Methylophilaceae bacterium]
MPLNALYVDFNSYFASIEQQIVPELRGKPVGVLPVMAETTCCIAASYEAKAFGINTGTIVRDARKLCKDIIFVKARPPLYV